MAFFADLDACTTQLGGKARSLARLAAAGLPTPGGFVVTDALFRALASDLTIPSRLDRDGLAVLDRAAAALGARPWPPDFPSELAERLQRAGASSWAVRSSFASEDRAGGLGAGVYESRVAVPTAEVEGALRRVLGSALSAGAVAYALAHGMSPAGPPVSVLLHPHVPGDAEGSAAWAPGLREPLVLARAGTPSPSATAALREAVRALGESDGAVEVEWVADGDRVVFLQMRPYQAPRAPLPWRGWAELGGESPHGWKWDLAHNPLPLSPAHAGLVALADEECRIGYRQRVLGGYLFYAPDPRPGPPAASFVEAEERFARLCAKVDAAAQGERLAVEDALGLFLEVHEQILGTIQPASRGERSQLALLVRQHAPGLTELVPGLYEGVESVAAERRRRAEEMRAAPDGAARLAAQARYLGLFGDESPVWDVSVPTHREQPEGLPAATLATPARARSAAPGWQEIAARIEHDLPPALRAQWRARLATSRRAAAMAEDDDWLYARAQAALRRALLQLGRRLADHGALATAGDVFWLPLSMLRALERGEPGASDLRAQVARARAAWEAARADPPPAPAAETVRVARGSGTAGRVLGRVCLLRPGGMRPIPADAVVVAQTLLPTELPLIDAAALVTEVGGALDHVAAQARERGLPAVVGAAGACSILADGDLALVDADHGVVVRLG